MKPREFWIYKKGTGTEALEYIQTKPDPGFIEEFVHSREVVSIDWEKIWVEYEKELMLVATTVHKEQHRKIVHELVEKAIKGEYGD